MSFVNINLTLDPDAMADAAVAYLQANVPGWQPAEGNLEMFLIEALARMNAELMNAASTVPPAAFSGYGKQLLAVAQEEGAYASITTTWTVQDNTGWTIPAGTTVGYRQSTQDVTLFETTAAVIVPAGSTSWSGVVLQAVNPGSASNGVPTGTLEVIDSLSYVNSCAATAVSSGGADPEADDAYLSRLAADLKLMSPRPILPGDFAVLAQTQASVYRALAINGYNPASGGSYSNPRYCTVAVVDVNGNALSSGAMTAVSTFLLGLREVNFVVPVIGPTYTTVNVTFTVHVLAGFDPTATVAACVAALQSWLSPATWGGGSQSPPVWLSTATTVRYLQTSDVLAQVPGVDYVASLTLNSGTSDVTLSGVAPLPTVGTVTGSAV